jgi:hypothetical protein
MGRHHPKAQRGSQRGAANYGLANTMFLGFQVGGIGFAPLVVIRARENQQQQRLFDPKGIVIEAAMPRTDEAFIVRHRVERLAQGTPF